MSDPCRQLEARLVEVGREELTGDAAMQAHLESCWHCAALLAAWDQTEDVMQKLPLVEAPAAEDAAGKALGPDEQPVWHAALAEQEVGPLALAEVERLWEDGALVRDSMVWKEGMSDWQPLTEVEELAYLLASYPQASSGNQAKGTETGDPAAASAGNASGWKAAAAAAPGDGSEWKPAAAKDLSALVSGELAQQLAAAEKEESPPAAAAGLPAPNAPNPDWLASPVQSHPAEGSWRLPQVKPQRRLRAVHLLLGGLASSAATGVVVLVVLLLRQSPVQVMVSAPAPVLSSAAPAGGVSSPAIAGGPAAVPAAKAGPAAEAADGRHRGAKGSKEKRLAEKAARSAAASGGGGGGGGKDGLDDLVSDKPTKDKLTPDDVKAGVKTNMANLLECLKAARAKGEISPGQHTLVLDWQIQPNGSVTNGQLKGPPNVLGTSLPACFAARMRSWKFPSSRSATPIRNFPFGPFNMK